MRSTVTTDQMAQADSNALVIALVLFGGFIVIGLISMILDLADKIGRR